MENTTDLPMYGYPGPVFTSIHVSAVISLLTSLSCSLFVILDSTCFARPKIKFWKMKQAQRLAVYVSFTDVVYTVVHTTDHIMMLVTVDHIRPDALCAVMAALIHVARMTKSIIACYMAMNAFFLVVRGKKIGLGEYDWILHVLSIGPPATLGIVFLALSFYGPSGAWCFVDARDQARADTVNYALYAVIIVCFIVICLSYIAVWIRISRSAKALKSSAARDSRTNRSAKTMMLFTLAYLGEWITYLLYAIWSIWSTPHVVSVFLVVTICNMGGVYYCMAYVVFKKRETRTEAQTTENASVQIVQKSPSTQESRNT